MNVEYDRPRVSYNFLCHGDNTADLCTVPNNMEVVVFAWHGELLTFGKTCLLFDWLRINNDGEVLTTWGLSQSIEKAFRLGSGIETTITIFGPNNNQCPDIEFAFVDDFQVNPKDKTAVLGIYDTSDARLEYHGPNFYPTPAAGKNIKLTQQAYKEFGLETFHLSKLLKLNAFTVNKNNGLTRLYIFSCRSGNIFPSDKMNIDLPPADQNIPGKPVIALPTFFTPHPGYLIGGAKRKNRSKKARKTRKLKAQKKSQNKRK